MKGNKMIKSESACDCVEDWAASLETFDAFQRVFNNQSPVAVAGDIYVKVWNDETRVYFKVYRLDPTLTFGNIRINNGSVIGFDPAVNSHEWETLIDAAWEECHPVTVNLKLGGVGGAGGQIEGGFTYIIKEKCCFECGESTVLDADENVYQTVQIGTQCWMAENLKTTRFHDLDATLISNVTDVAAWLNSTTSAYCWYDNDYSTYGSVYGALYNWHAVETGKLCPTGWHVPTDEEWKTMEMFLGMSESAANSIFERGTDEGGKLKEAGTSHWESPNTGANNSSGFTALPGGWRCYDSEYDEDFFFVGYFGVWWSSSVPSTSNASSIAWSRMLFTSNSKVGRYTPYRNYGFSVRCVRD
jgi:uncharacterized protein (TIGR02145 family)